MILLFSTLIYSSAKASIIGRFDDILSLSTGISGLIIFPFGVHLEISSLVKSEQKIYEIFSSISLTREQYL